MICTYPSDNYYFILKQEMEKLSNKIAYQGEMCLNCLSEPEGYCSVHKPKEITLNDVWAITCEHLYKEGIFKRESQNTYSLKL